MSVVYEVGLDVLVCLHFYTVFFSNGDWNARV